MVSYIDVDAYQHIRKVNRKGNCTLTVPFDAKPDQLYHLFIH